MSATRSATKKRKPWWRAVKVTQAMKNEALLRAVKDGDLAAAQQSIADGAKYDRFARNEDDLLLAAVKGGKAEIVAAVLTLEGVDPNKGLSYWGPTIFQAAVKTGNLPVVQVLFNAGGDVNDVSGEWTALSYAVAAQDRPMAEYLVEKGAKVNRRSKQGRSALFYAARNGDTGMIDFLLENGANLYFRDRDGCSALDIAARYERHAAFSLLQKKIDADVPEWRKIDDDRVTHVEILRDAGYRLTEVFNFKTAECKVITHNFETGRDSTTVRRFDQTAPSLIETATAVRAAAQ